MPAEYSGLTINTAMLWDMMRLFSSRIVSMTILIMLSFFYSKLNTVSNLSIFTVSILLAAWPITLPDKREEPLSDLFILFLPSCEIEPPMPPLASEGNLSNMFIAFLFSFPPPLFYKVKSWSLCLWCFKDCYNIEFSYLRFTNSL